MNRNHPLAYRISIIFVLLCLPVMGCGNRAPFKTEPIDGTVTLENQPLVGAIVGLSPMDSEQKPAYAKSDSQGKFRVTSVEGGLNGKGAMAGIYKICVSKNAQVRALSSEELKYLKSRGLKEKFDTISLIPEKYVSTETSGLTFEVKPGKNVLNINLEWSEN